MFSRRGLSILLCTLGLVAELQALPRRLVLCLDGVSFRDVKALQEGTVTDARGRRRPTRAFDHGYYPVSRLVSTFPSCSDVAWTEMLGNPPLPGYQRTYFDIASNQVIAHNGITSTMEYENQMHYQEQGGWHRAFGYLAPIHEFKREVRLLIENFLGQAAETETYYAMLRTTDDAQHMSADIFSMLQLLDQRLAGLQQVYRARTGRALEILILSDHGNNHAGPGKRLPVIRFLKRAGYRITTSILDRHDVILPTVGIQSWAEIHNAPAETPNLVSRLVRLEGVDLVVSRIPDRPDEFLVCNRKGARALITCDPLLRRYRYATISGDPLQYAAVLEFLRKNHALDESGFASAEVWMRATLAHWYPVALERIARGLSSNIGNPATILLSLDNHYIHANFLVCLGSRLVTCAGTHGGLDDLNSNGILISNFKPTSDTTTARLAAQFGGFAGRNHHDTPREEMPVILSSRGESGFRR